MTAPVTNRVPMRVVDARRPGPPTTDPESLGVVLLGEVGGERSLAIWIGPDEATEIALALERVQLPRPFTFDFMAQLLKGAGGKLLEVRVTELRGSLFIGEAVLENGAVIDARPSDALTLALILDAPIFVAEALLCRFDGGTDESRRPPADWTFYETASKIANDFRAFHGRGDLPR